MTKTFEVAKYVIEIYTVKLIALKILLNFYLVPCWDDYTRCGYKINGINFFRFPVNLATAIGMWYWLVLSPPIKVTN